MDLDLPGGVITTHCVSAVIRPGSKVTHDPLQFVKIQSTELSKKAVEQIRLAEEVKITKDKIKEVEEEWQNNLLNWKSKRRQSRSTNCPLNSESLGEESDDPNGNPRKIKTFSEILNEKAKSGYRIGYNLHKYIRNGSEDDEDEEEDEDEGCKMMEDDSTSRLSSSSDDSSNTKKMIDSAISENLANTLISESLRVNKDGKHEDENDNDGDDDDDGDDETAHDSVVDRSVKLVNQSTNGWRCKVAIQCQSDGDNNKLIEQQINLKNNSHNVDGNQGNVNHHNQHNNQVNSNKQLDKMDSSIKPLNTNFRRNEICRINSYNCANSINNENNKQTGRRVILKFKIEKDVSRQSSLPLLTSSSSSSPSLSTSSSQCDKESANWSSSFSSSSSSSSSDEITKDGQENEPRLSFRDKLSNFESLAKGEDIGSSCHLNNHQLNQSSLNHSKERKLSVTESSSQSAISGQTVSTSSSSSSLHLNSEQIKNSTEIPNPDSESTSSNSNIFPDLSPKPKPALPPRPAIGERKSLPVGTKLHQNVSRTSSDSSATAVSDKIHSNYFRFATKPYTNPRIVKQSNGNKPVVCLQGSLSSITSTSSSSSSSSPPSSSSTSLSLPFQEISNSSGPNNIKSNTNSISSNSNEDDDTKFSNSRTASNSHNAIKTSIKSNNNSINSSTSTPATTSDTVTAVNGLTKASFKHLSLSPQTSNSSVNSCNNNRTGSPLTTSAQLDSITTTNTIPDSGRPSSHQGSPQIIDIRTSNGTRSSNGQGDGESKRSNYPNILISPFKVHRPIINSVSSENLSDSHRSSSSCSLGEKAFSEAQLIKKSNENLKSHDQRSMLSISGKKKCSNCGDELGRGCAAMVIETLSLYYHINCFRCSVCHIQLGNGTCGTDVRVRSNRLHCQNCYSNDEVGLTRV